MSDDIQYTSHRSPYVDPRTSYKPQSGKYKYQLSSTQNIYRPNYNSQFSPYKQTYYPHKENMSDNKSLPVREFSPYKSKLHSPQKKPFDALELKQNHLLQNFMLDTRKNTDYNALQHTANIRENIIQEQALINHQLAKQLTYYKQLNLDLQNQLEIMRDRSEKHYERGTQENIKNMEVIQQMKQEIQILLYKNSLLLQKQQYLRASGRNDERIKKEQRSQKKPKHKNKQNQSEYLKEIEEILVKQTKANRYLSDYICCKKDTKGNIASALKRLSRLQLFVHAIFDSKTKILKDKNKETDLKNTWRWLKSVIQQAAKYQKLREYEPILTKQFGVHTKKNIEQLIPQLLQKY